MARTGVKIMEKDEIRAVVSLPAELGTQIMEQQRMARRHLPNDVLQAVISIHAAWKLLPAPKFNTSASDAVLRDCIYILNFALKHDEAKQLLERWIKDLETNGHAIGETNPYLLAGETCLFLEQPAGAITYLQKAFKTGGEAAFTGAPALYLEMATQKSTDHQLIMQAFEKEDLLETWFKREEATSAGHTISQDMFVQIDQICEAGSEWFDEREYKKAISTWERAFDLIPAPKSSFSQDYWLHSSIGDAFFLLQDFEKATAHLLAAKSNTKENGYADSLLVLRLGQSCFETGDTVKAKEYLLRAYLLGGRERFDQEDKKYIDFLGKHVQL